MASPPRQAVPELASSYQASLDAVKAAKSASGGTEGGGGGGSLPKDVLDKVGGGHSRELKEVQ